MTKLFCSINIVLLLQSIYLSFFITALNPSIHPSARTKKALLVMFDTQNSSLSIFRLVVNEQMWFVFFTALSLCSSFSLWAMCWLSRPSRLSCHHSEWRMWVEWRLTSYATQTLHLSFLSFSIYPSSPPLPSFSFHLNQNSFRSHRGSACGLLIPADLLYIVWRDVTAVCYSSRKCDLFNRKFLLVEWNLECGCQLS